MIKRSLCLLVLLFVFSNDVRAGIIYQNFEPDNGSPLNTWSVGTALITTADRNETAHFGLNAIKVSTPFYWSGFGTTSQVAPGNLDIKQNNNDRLTFWTYALPQRACYIYGCENGSDNNVGVIFYDNNIYSTTGFEVWTTTKAVYRQWTKLQILFSQLPPDFDLQHVAKIEFKNYLPGTYYFDDIHAVREDRVYQSFNSEFRSGSTTSDYGWKWNDADTATLTVDGEPVFEGGHAWKTVLNGKWGGGGFQSEQQTYFFNEDTQQAEQSFWRTNLLPENNDRLSLWVYGLPVNELDNNLNVQLYDHGSHSTDATKAEAWTKVAAHSGNWTRLEVLFSDLPSTLNLRDLDKIQIQHYWNGTFYIDDIRATGPHPVIKENTLSLGSVNWDAVAGAQNYRLQKSTDGPNGPWVTIYSGAPTTFNISGLGRAWLRVRWEETFIDKNSLPYSSPWSDVVEYNPPTVNLNFNSLLNGQLTFNSIPQTSLYEIATALDPAGSWTQIYKGPALRAPLTATLGQWYRVRAIVEQDGIMTDSTAWSKAQRYSSPGTGFVKANGTVIKDNNGTGNELILTGVNLGNYLLIEDWMTGLGMADVPAILDDWTLRDVLTSRFGATQTENLLKTFQNAYLNDYDFDRIAQANMTMVRLPIFYRNLMDDNGDFILNGSGQIDFSQIDRVVDAMADRGVYTLLDLHGAPGSQSPEFHTGRKDFNKLFENSPAGATYRDRTETLWVEIAKHYKNNPWVVGYDLLNEPTGAAPNNVVLADLYDRLYDAIRAIDPHHLIVMEGIWYQNPTNPSETIDDWGTLPRPADRGWTNVMYQFHFYNWGADEDFNSHKNYMDAKVAKAALEQPLYNVPLMIGEFYGFGLKDIWEYYLSAFNAQKWSWTSWSYKYQSSPSTWGIYNNAKYDEDLPKFRTDSYADLVRKLSKYTTTDHHVVSPTLLELLKSHSEEVLQASSLTVAQAQNAAATDNFNPGEDGTFTINGQGMCDTPGAVEFYPTFCNDLPPGSTACNYGDAAITFWSETLIKGFVPPDYSPGSFGGTKVHCVYGGTLYPTMISDNQAPVLNPIANRVVNEGQLLSFGLTATDPDGDVLTYSALNLPAGASLSGQTFSWTPNYAQAGNYNVTFRVSDGILTDEQNVNITVVNTPLPDFIVTELSGPTTGVTGGAIAVRNTIRNQGQASSGGTVTIGVYLSTDPVITTSDPRIYARSSGTLTPGMTNTLLSNISLSSTLAPGTYYLGAIVDYGNARLESDETNNILAGNQIVITPGADIVSTVINGPASIVSGSQVTLSDTVMNQGVGAVSSFSVGYYLSTDPVITTADTRVGTRSISSLTAGASNNGTIVVNIPLNYAAGNYYWGSIVDYANQRPEANETNNTLTGAVVSVVSGVDLVSIVLNGPANVVTGSSVTLTDTVRNQGVGTVGSFSVGYYLSTDPVITTSDTRVGARSISSLAAGASNNGTIAVNIPVNYTVGNYYWGVIVDYTNQRPETNETNNTRTTAAVSVTPGPDLAMTVVSGPSAAVRGTSIPINNTVANQGTGSSGYFYVAFYLSTDNVITTSDRFLVYRYVSSLAANGALNSATTSALIPASLSAGTYYIGAIADFDNRSKESIETNNALAGNMIVVTVN